MSNHINTPTFDDIPIAVAHVVEEPEAIISQPKSLKKSTIPDENHRNDAINQRISGLLEKISDKEHVMGNLRENSLSTRRTIVSIVGEAFITKIESDPAWLDALSQEFEEKYLNHDFPSIATLASHLKDMALLKVEIQQLNKSLGRLREDIVHNDMVPAELYRLIEDLREQLCSRDEEMKILKTRLDERDGREKALADKKRILDSITATPFQSGSYANGRFSQYANGWTCAVSSITLPRDQVSTWDVYLNMPSICAFIGVVGPLKAGSQYSINYSTVFSWGNPSQVCMKGVNHADPQGWPGWANGDTARFTYDPVTSLLTLHLHRTNKDYKINVNGNLTDCYIFLALCHQGNYITIC